MCLYIYFGILVHLLSECPSGLLGFWFKTNLNYTYGVWTGSWRGVGSPAFPRCPRAWHWTPTPLPGAFKGLYFDLSMSLGTFYNREEILYKRHFSRVQTWTFSLLDVCMLCHGQQNFIWLQAPFWTLVLKHTWSSRWGAPGESLVYPSPDSGLLKIPSLSMVSSPRVILACRNHGNALDPDS